MSLALKQRLACVSPLVWLLAFTGGLLALFAGKAFHIDDTLFLRAAEQIQKHPADFYGFRMNWYGSTRPMVENFDNPPLACYYLAIVAGFAGWRETALHLSFLLPALAAVWGIFSIAKLYGARPLISAVAALMTPVFLISATTLMCDVMLLAFWVWSVFLFERGLREDNRAALLASGFLAGLAFLTKFSGAALVPLLFAYGLANQRTCGRWLIAVLVPLLFVAVYEFVTFHLYGKGLLLTAAGVSSACTFQGASLWAKTLVGLSFLGGCYLPILFYLPWLWSARSIIRGSILIAPCLLAYPYLGQFSLLWNIDGRLNWLVCLQSAVFIASGAHILLLAAAEVWNQREATSLLLLLWVLGIFAFASIFNWTLNGRSLLPMAAAVGILVGKRLSRRSRPTQSGLTWHTLWPALAAVGLSLFLAKMDYDLANTGRAAAHEMCTKYAPKRPWFEGHWGFQYYMERLGAKPLEHDCSQPVPGELIVVPSEAVNLFDLPTNFVRLVDTLQFTPNAHCTTMNSLAGAGFYAGTAGPFPFSIWYINPEHYYVFEVVQPMCVAAKTPAGPFVAGAVMRQFEIERKIIASAQGLHQ